MEQEQIVKYNDILIVYFVFSLQYISRKFNIPSVADFYYGQVSNSSSHAYTHSKLLPVMKCHNLITHALSLSLFFTSRV